MMCVQKPGRRHIRHFSFEFVDAPYFFKSTAKISFPNYLSIETNEDWSSSSKYKQLEFSISNSDRDENPYVWDQKLHLNYELKKETIELAFDLPVIYWKYSKDSECSFYDTEVGNLSILKQQ